MSLNIRNLKIESPDFKPLGRMNEKHAADKQNVAPALKISGVPAEAVELAVICHDPDAPLPHGFTHWTIYGVQPTTGVLSDAQGRYRLGPNGLGEAKYFGPRPPNGHGPHHYYFWVYALSKKVEGEPSRETFLEKYADHIVEQNRVVGIYEN